MLNKKLSRMIREARIEHDLSEQELGDLMGLSHVSISHWEGDRRIPQDMQLRRLADILNLDLQEMINLAEAERCEKDLSKLEARYKGKFKKALLKVFARELNED